jgi:hypothetical protein
VSHPFETAEWKYVEETACWDQATISMFHNWKKKKISHILPVPSHYSRLGSFFYHIPSFKYNDDISLISTRQSSNCVPLTKHLEEAGAKIPILSLSKRCVVFPKQIFMHG